MYVSLEAWRARRARRARLPRLEYGMENRLRPAQRARERDKRRCSRDRNANRERQEKRLEQRHVEKRGGKGGRASGAPLPGRDPPATPHARAFLRSHRGADARRGSATPESQHRTETARKAQTPRSDTLMPGSEPGEGARPAGPGRATPARFSPPVSPRRRFRAVSSPVPITGAEPRCRRTHARTHARTHTHTGARR